MNKILKELCLYRDEIIKNAINKLNKNGKKFLIVLNNDNTLFGTVTDGDIRRAFLKNTSLKNKISSITNKSPIYVLDDFKKKKILEIFDVYKITHIPVISKSNKVIDVLDINNFNIHALNNTKIFILAGGMGRRLYPITKNLPKPIVNLKKKNISILENLIRNFQNFGFFNFYVSVNYLKEKIINSENLLDYKITYLSEKKILGTAGPLYLLKKFLKKKETVIVINGDVVVDINFLDLIQFHEKNKCDVSIVCKKVTNNIDYGVVKIDSRNNVKDIIEKPSYSNYINCGIYIFSSNTFNYLKSEKFLNMDDFLRLLIETKLRIKLYEFDGFWIDIGNKQNLKFVNNMPI